MKRLISILLTSAMLALGLTALVNVAAPPVAEAAGECGSGYTKIHSHPLTLSGGSTRTGTLEVYYKSSTKWHCAINRCYGGFCGQGMYRGVSLTPSNMSTPNCNPGGSVRCDVGWFSYYAGPVYSKSLDNCTHIYAWSSSSSTYGTTNGSRHDWHRRSGSC